ncbi:MAG: hypothetical protein JWR43_48, partial [Phenylobacterium sp.]|nr:hypothetical protein [Phenylobacterium sp.]
MTEGARGEAHPEKAFGKRETASIALARRWILLSALTRPRAPSVLALARQATTPALRKRKWNCVSSLASEQPERRE